MVFGVRNAKQKVVVSTISVLVWFLILTTVHGSGEAPVPEHDSDEESLSVPDSTFAPVPAPTMLVAPTLPVVDDDYFIIATDDAIDDAIGDDDALIADDIIIGNDAIDDINDIAEATFEPSLAPTFDPTEEEDVLKPSPPERDATFEPTRIPVEEITETEEPTDMPTEVPETAEATGGPTVMPTIEETEKEMTETEEPTDASIEVPEAAEPTAEPTIEETVEFEEEENAANTTTESETGLTATTEDEETDLTVEEGEQTGDVDIDFDEGDDIIDGNSTGIGDVDGNTEMDENVVEEIDEGDVGPDDANVETGGGTETESEAEIITANSLLRKACAAVGGEEALRNLRYLEIVSTGETAIEFESTTPEEVTPTSQYARNLTFDLENAYLRIDEVYTPKFGNFQFLAPSLVTSNIQGSIGEQVGAKVDVPSGAMSSAAVAAITRQQVLFNPHFLLQYALVNEDLLEYNGQDAVGNDILVIPDPDGIRNLNMFLANDTGLIRKVQTRESNPLTRDRRVVIRFFGWNIVAQNSDLLFPRNVRLNNQNGQQLWGDTRSDVIVAELVPEDIFSFVGVSDVSFVVDEIGVDIGKKSSHFVNGIQAAGFEFSYRDEYGPIEELAEGLVYLLPNSYNSIAVRHDDGIVLLEAPISNFQGALLHDLVATEFGAPVTHLIQSHFHVDFASGVREVLALAETAVFVIGFGTEEFYLDNVFAARSNIIPDTWEEMPPEDDAAIFSVGFDEKETLLETSHIIVEAFHTSRSSHAIDMLITTITVKDEMIFVYQADLYNGGLGSTVVQGGPESLFAALRDNDILAEGCASTLPLIIISSHGFVLPLEQALLELDENLFFVGCVK